MCYSKLLSILSLTVHFLDLILERIPCLKVSKGRFQARFNFLHPCRMQVYHWVTLLSMEEIKRKIIFKPSKPCLKVNRNWELAGRANKRASRLAHYVINIRTLPNVPLIGRINQICPLRRVSIRSETIFQWHQFDQFTRQARPVAIEYHSLCL